jgi:hypothetical protein
VLLNFNTRGDIVLLSSLSMSTRQKISLMKKCRQERKEAQASSPTKQTAEHFACIVDAQSSRRALARFGDQPAAKWVAR